MRTPNLYFVITVPISGDRYTFQNNKFIDETGKIHRVTFQGLIAEEDSENDF